MYKKVTISIVIISAILVGSLFFIPEDTEASIKAEIKKANYCEIDSDCVDAGSKCPFGCYAYVNKNEVDKISDLISSYDSRCVYSCLACPQAKCVNNKCEEVCQ